MLKRVLFSIFLVLAIFFVFKIYADWYFNLPVVMKDPYGQVVGVEWKGDQFEVESEPKKIGGKYLVRRVSFEWEPDE
ncbi:MAG: hypothetical protein ACLFNN_01630 [Candidatus Paceibacterota bacterium]